MEAEGLLGLPGLVVEGLCGAALWAEVVVVADTRVFDAGALGAAVVVGLAVAAADDLVVEGLGLAVVGVEVALLVALDEFFRRVRIGRAADLVRLLVRWVLLLSLVGGFGVLGLWGSGVWV